MRKSNFEMPEPAIFDSYYTLGGKSFAFDIVEIVVVAIGGLLMLIAVVGTMWTFFQDRNYRRELDDQLQRLQDFEIKGPACDLKSRLIGVQAQMDWKDYFSAPEPQFSAPTTKKRKSKLSTKRKKPAKLVIQE